MKHVLSALFVVAVALPAMANDPAIGIWAAPPDGKGQVGHIKVAPCGTALCGTIIRAYSPEGKQITTSNVGKRLFWDMRPNGKGDYDGGRVYVPAHAKEYDAKMQIKGGRLSVKGCVGPICQGQTWSRVQ
ncbi:DUF2147 domain-containing protein [Pelagicola sp. LXJ1103]|nr:DUF2147 domain-containing protein [Pelagicola sp. LXJ1103]